jgi:hypothetical protein
MQTGMCQVSIAIGSVPDCRQAGGTDICLHRLDKTGLEIHQSFHVMGTGSK